jgi:hypothetical protein
MLLNRRFETKNVKGGLRMNEDERNNNSPVIGGLEIRRNGGIFIKKSLARNLSDEDFKKFDITVEFLVHALNRMDWMTEFMQSKMIREQARKKSELKSSFRVIEGGGNESSEKK